MPWAPLRRCAEAGCTARQGRARCALHDRVSPRNHRGASPTARGYDAEYRRRRAALAIARLHQVAVEATSTRLTELTERARIGALDILGPSIEHEAHSALATRLR